MSSNDPHLRDAGFARAARAATARAVAAVGLAGVALIHLLDAPDTFAATPYKGWLFVALIVGCLFTAAALLRGDDPRAWTAAAALCLGALAAFVWSRTVGLPQSADDIGNWWEPLGLASVFVEGAVVVLCAGVLHERAGSLVPYTSSRAERAHSTAAAGTFGS